VGALARSRHRIDTINRRERECARALCSRCSAGTRLARISRERRRACTLFSRMCLSSVVLPLPRKPERSVIGTALGASRARFAAGTSTDIADERFLTQAEAPLARVAWGIKKLAKY